MEDSPRVKFESGGIYTLVLGQQDEEVHVHVQRHVLYIHVHVCKHVCRCLDCTMYIMYMYHITL